MGLSPYWGGAVDGDEELTYQQMGYKDKPTVGDMKMRVGHGGYKDDDALPMASGSLKRVGSEAFAMGKHLGKHLHSLHGGDFYSDFSKGYTDAQRDDLVGGSGAYEGKGFTASEVRKAKRLAKLHGGAWYDFLDPAKNGLKASVEDTGNKIKNEFENPSSKLRQVVDPAVAKVKNEFENPDSKLRGEYLPKVAYELGNPDSDFNSGVSQYMEPVVNAFAPGLGSVSKKAFDAMNEGKRKAGLGKSTVEDYRRLINPKKAVETPKAKAQPTRYGNAKQTAKALGKGFDMSKPMPPRFGRAGKGRQPVCPQCGKAKCECSPPPVETMAKPKRMVGGAVSARAAIVKKVMAEKGMKMIEASKYVKAHGLY
jgi:hypothetical protein